MARAGAVYPQVEPRAAALADRRIAAGRPRARAEQALAACRRVGARALVLAPRGAAREADLARAVSLGLGALPVGALAWPRLPVVGAAAPEIQARRLLASGTPMVLVREGRRVVGMIERDRAGVDGTGMSLASRLDHLRSRQDAARLRLLRAAGTIGERLGAPVYAVGGFVRDLMLGRVALDIDLVVEGDGIAFARRLCEQTGGVLTVHEGFGTASIAAAAGGDAPLPAVDVASSRRERYERPGALPLVSPGDLTADLMRRDFTINAMALVLAPSGFGRLVDPCGGRHDLRRRVLRPLHPLSFVEDPTRLFRAARYAARLGARLGPDARVALALALRIGDFPALSGQRLRAEIDLLAAEAEVAAGAFDRALRWGLFRLWDRRFRAVPGGRAQLRAVRRFDARARAAGAAVDERDLTLLALLAGQSARVVGACLDRLAVTGRPRRALAAAAASRGLVERLARTIRPSAIADMLGPLSVTELAGAWLLGPAATRRRIEWFLRNGRAARPILSGEDLIAFGLPRGPAVGRYLSRLRRERLDGGVKTAGEEYESLRRWLAQSHPATVPARKEASR